MAKKAAPKAGSRETSKAGSGSTAAGKKTPAGTGKASRSPAKPTARGSASSGNAPRGAAAKRTGKPAAKPAAKATKEPVKKMPKTTTAGGSAALHGYAPYKPKRGEEYMSAGQMEHFKKLLYAWRQELMEEVDRTVTHMKDEAANFPDPADRATQEEEFSLELRTRDRERKLIKKIDSTLERIENDDYGFCDQCGIEIGIRRLEARPTATLCVDCKTLDEIKERQLTGA